MSTLIQRDSRRLAREMLPTMYDLPSEEIGDAGMPDEYHVQQAMLLNETFRPTTVSSDEVFSAVDMNLYYDVRHPLWYKRPDWFGVVGAPRLYEGRDSRLSYVVWQEGIVPLIVVELLSPGTENEDLGRTLRDVTKPPTKWEVYERILRVPYYAVFSRDGAELRIFQLRGGRYARAKMRGGRGLIPEAGLALGLWKGSYHGQERLWLRWHGKSGSLILTPAEQAEQERGEKEAALEQLEQERQRAARLEEMLRQLGQNPDKL